MTRKDQKDEIRIVSAELRDKLDHVDSLRVNNLLSVADRKAKSLPLLDEFRECMAGFMPRLKKWVLSGDVETEIPTADGKEYMVKSESFTMEYKLRQMDKFQNMCLREQLIYNEIAKMPSMPELPEAAPAIQINQQNNYNVPPDYDAGSDFEKFKQAKEAGG